MDNSRRVSRWPVLVLIVGLGLAVALVLLGAELAGRPVTSPPIGTPGIGSSPRVVTIIMRDYRFDPTPIVLVPGETVRLSVFNGGLVTHDLVLGDADVQRAWGEAEAAATPPGLLATAPPASVPPETGGLRVVLDSGDQAVVEYLVPTDEQLALLCHIPGHIERGMVGAVELRAAPAGS